jgi:ABC-type multidrug transport system fused ATPase/permease subunit
LSEEKLQSWPTKGDITFKDVHMRYRPKCELVLKGLDFKVPGGQKIGIVGRTGAGKSTIINCLSRICEIEKGTMEIDGVDISDIPVSQLRDIITVIPQDPTLFSGSLRFNVDPVGKSSDKEILALLKKAGLHKLLTKERTSNDDRKKGKKKKKIVRDFSDSEETTSSDEESEEEKDKDLEGDINGPLDVSVTEGGDNLSSGEKQLICICRAILRKRKIIVLDEATANIDLITEQKIQDLMKSEFKD